MDTNQNLQQIHTFTKGMDTDTSDFYLSNDKYRYAENVRPTVDSDNNAGELHLISGTEKALDLEDGDEILSLSNIRDICVLVVKNKNTWRIDKFNVGQTNRTTIFKDESGQNRLWTDTEEEPYDSNKKYISTVLRWESENNVKLYIADGIHELMSINIMNDYSGQAYKQVFGYQQIALPKLQTQINSNGQLKAGSLQYVYRIYLQNGSSSDISPVTERISLYQSVRKGYESGKTTNHGVTITLPELDITDDYYIEIYRINYVQAGQAPEIHLIKDQKFVSGSSVTDTGTNIKSIVQSEFQALRNVHMSPQIIESKNDYLFAGGVRYSQDDIDKIFANFDARAFSSGDYILNNNGEKVYILNNSLIDGGGFNVQLDEVTLDNLRHDWADSGVPPIGTVSYNPEYRPGRGKYVSWEYVYKDFSWDVNESNVSFRWNEVYRFGIRLYDTAGNASSVKWIGDILMPNGYKGRVDKRVGIRFYINFTQFYTDFPDNAKIFGYEIVRCVRSESDKFTITTGISGFPLGTQYSDTYQVLSNPGIITKSQLHIENTTPVIIEAPATGWLTVENHFFSTNGWESQKLDEIDSGEEESGPYYIAEFYRYPIGGRYGGLRAAWSDPSVLLFASPEYCFQTEYIKEVINRNIESARIQPEYIFYGDFNNQEYLYGRPYGYDPGFPENLTNKYLPGEYITMDADGYGGWFRVNRGDRFVAPKTVDGLNEAGYRFKVVRYEGNDGWRYYSNPSICNYQRYTNSIVDNTFNESLTRVLSAVFFNDYRYSYKEGSNQVSSTSFSPTNNTTDIKNVYFITESPDAETFIGGDGNHQYTSSMYYLEGGLRFVNWSIPLYSAYEGISSEEQFWPIYKELLSDGNVDRRWYIDSWPYNPGTPSLTYSTLNAMPQSTGGKLMVIQTKNASVWEGSHVANTDIDSVPAPCVCVDSIRKMATPYGGQDRTSIENSVYYSFGDFKKYNQVYAENSIDVFSGDCYICSFIYNAAHCWSSDIYKYRTTRMATVYELILPSDVDLKSQYGFVYGDISNKSYLVQDVPKNFTVSGYQQDQYAYQANLAYSQQPQLFPSTSNTTTKAYSNLYDDRVLYSLKKTNGENVDNWTHFQTADTLDVDSRFGRITDMKLFKDKLMFWQERACGVLSVNERTLLNTADDAQIILGTSSVLERYDYITQTFGQKPNQYTSCLTDNAVYWWDGNKKEILQYTDGYNVNPLSTAARIKNYVNAHNESSTPNISYDIDHNEVICNVVNNESVIYNEQIQAFTSVYRFAPKYNTVVKDRLYLTNPGKTQNIYEWEYTPQSKAVLFGSDVCPRIDYVVNASSNVNKVFDSQTIGGRFYGGGESAKIGYDQKFRKNEALLPLTFTYETPLKQKATANGTDMTNVEYDFRLAVPRNVNEDKFKKWGDRLRGKTMRCSLTSSSSDLDFSLQYITTKFRISWI